VLISFQFKNQKQIPRINIVILAFGTLGQRAIAILWVCPNFYDAFGLAVVADADIPPKQRIYFF
jgi:hypothetical protein